MYTFVHFLWAIGKLQGEDYIRNAKRMSDFEQKIRKRSTVAMVTVLSMGILYWHAMHRPVASYSVAMVIGAFRYGIV